MMEKTDFVTKDNVHEATNLEKIRSLMANAERLGEDEVVKKCKKRIGQLTMEKYQIKPEIQNIKFTYWKDKNPFYGKTSPLTSSIKTAQTKLKDHCNIIFEFEYCGEITEAIEEKIKQFIKNPTDDIAVEVLDLIQLWGGKEGVRLGRNDFYKSVRMNTDDWLPSYLKFINDTLKCKTDLGDPKNALAHFKAIKGIGMSFGTKHLRWWGEYPIYDSRISLLLYGEDPISTINDSALNFYTQYLSDIKDLAAENNLSVQEIEQSLFAFSQNFFPNSKLDLKKNIKYDEQTDLAKILSNNST